MHYNITSCYLVKNNSSRYKFLMVACKLLQCSAWHLFLFNINITGITIPINAF